MTKNSFVAKVTFHILKSDVSLSFLEQFCKDNIDNTGNYVSSFQIVEFKSPIHLRGATFIT